MKKIITVIACLLALALCMTACGRSAPQGLQLSTGGVLVLRVNPEIAVSYDAQGVVTKVTARNQDAHGILADCTDLVGKDAADAVSQLVLAMGRAGYLAAEIEGQTKEITLQIQPGSGMPTQTFLEDMVAQIKTCVEENSWGSSLVVEGESDFGRTDYDPTSDYGQSDYGTNYDSPYDATTDYGTNYDSPYDATTDYGTNYDSPYDATTDYGTNYDSPYDATTDYGTNYDTPYDATSDYGTNYDTPYDATSDYDNDSAYEETDYDDSDYGDSAYDDSDYGSSDFS